MKNTKRFLALLLAVVMVIGMVPSAAATETTTESAPTESTPTESTPTESTPTESTPTESTPTESTPTESTPTESTPTESTPTESTPTESTPTESTPTESTPTESTPTESTPTESTPTESTPTESTPTESTPEETLCGTCQQAECICANTCEDCGELEDNCTCVPEESTTAPTEPETRLTGVIPAGTDIFANYTDDEYYTTTLDYNIVILEECSDEYEMDWYRFETDNWYDFVLSSDYAWVLAGDVILEGEEAFSEEEDILDDLEPEEIIDEEPEEQFETPVNFTKVAELISTVKTSVQSFVQAVFSSSSSSSATAVAAVAETDEDDAGGEDDTGDEDEDDGGSQEGEETEPTVAREDNPNIITEKTVIYDEETGKYKLRLESYLTGEPTITTDERKPSDIVVVLDQSGSMDNCFYCGDDKADSLVKVYSGLSLSTRYYVKATSSATSGTSVYYCDSGDACKYVDSSGNKKTHTAGWFDKKHSTMSTSTNAGTRYYSSAEDSPSWTARVFYTKKDLSAKATFNIVTDGIYYRSVGGVLTRIYYCKTCHAWFDKTNKTCNTTNHTKSTALYPEATSSDEGHRTPTFYHYNFKHYVTDRADLPSNATKFYMKSVERTTGDSYQRIYYVSGNKWRNSDSSATYTFPTDFIDGRIYYQCPINRNKALTNALDGFLEDIYKDSAGEDGTLGTADDVKNRIAVVGFGSYNEATSSGYPPTNALLSYAKNTSTTTATTVGYSALTSSHYKKALHYVNTANGQSVINSAVDSLQMISNTETYRGIEIANNIFKNNPVTAGERNRIMVVFTDGYPYSGLTDADGRTGNFAFANNAIANSITTKNTYGATVYSIGIFSGANASNMTSTCSYTGTDNTKRANKFMHLISSNYLNPTTLQAAYTASDVNPELKTGSSYYLSASTTEALNDIFKSIAQSIAGGGAYITTLDGSTVVKDVVTKEFTIPNSGADANISVHTEAFAGEDSKVMTWTNDSSTIDKALNVTLNGNTVTVTGFDFAKYYVATDVDNGENIPRGRKLVIEIPIEPASTNIGGLDQDTNEPESGIYLGSTCYENFEIPSVDIQTDITIQKSVTGSAEDKKLNFAFTTSAKYFEKETAYAPAGNDGSSGNYLYFDEVNAKAGSFDLKDTESETISNLLVGETLTFGETDGTGYIISDYDVTVEIKDANNNDVAYTKDEATGKYSVTVVPGMTIKVTNARRFADLKITKKGAESVDEYQSFIFDVTGPDGYSTKVTIYGNNSTTLKDLPVGTYTVTEAENWSWRYDATTYKNGLIDAAEESLTEGASVNLSTGSMQVLVTNSRTNNKWLDGNSYCKNIFGSSTPIKQPTN